MSYHDGASDMGETATAFHVAGAGYLAFDDSSCATTGNAVGISVKCGWARHGNTGGVMDIKEVQALRDLLAAWLAECKEDVQSMQSHRPLPLNT